MFQDPAEFFLKYRETLLEAEVGYWELDLSTHILSWDEAYRRLLEKDEGQYQILLEKDFDVIHEDYREKVLNYFKAVQETDDKILIIYRINSKKQDIKYIRLSATRNKKDGRTVSLTGVCWDFTSEILLQTALTESKEFTESILDAIPAAVFVKNEQYQTIYASSEFRKFTDLSREKIIGKTDFEIFPKSVAEVFRKTDSEVFEKDESIEFEISIQNSVGEPRDIYSTKSVIKVAPNKRYLVGTALDITELKNVQRSLIKQSKMASLGEMAAEIAHEINNPLMIIQGKSQILLGKIHSKNASLDTCRKDLEQIESNCVRIDKIIKSLKSVTRKADQDPFESVSLISLIEEAFEISFVRFSKKKLKLTISWDEQVAVDSPVSARPSEIVQVLVNLLNNSYDAIHGQPNGWAQIHVTTKKKFHLIEITDSGPEIPPEIARKMMEPFFTTKSSGKGTGLGLSVSSQIITNHGGELNFEPSRPHTCFIFTLPKAKGVG